MEEQRYLGKFRGTVVNNVDPENRGRIQAVVPDVQGTVPLTYALPCLPVAGKGSGAFYVPEIGSGVWIEFEQGDPEYPIWTGCFWGSTAEMPEMGIASLSPFPNIAFQTTGKNSLTIFGNPDGGVIISAGPLTNALAPKIIINSTGIILTNGQAEITMTGNMVNINKGALVVQ